MQAAIKANGILIVAALMWSIGGLFIKLVELSPMAITGTRSLAAAGVLLVYLRKVKWHWNKYFIFGVISYAAMMVLYVTSIRLTTAANAIFLEFTAPVYVVVLSYFILDERVTLFDIISMIIIFCGMGLFFFDELTFEGFWGNILAAIAGVCLGIVTVMLRKEKEYAFEMGKFLFSFMEYLEGQNLSERTKQKYQANIGSFESNIEVQFMQNPIVFKLDTLSFSIA